MHAINCCFYSVLLTSSGCLPTSAPSLLTLSSGFDLDTLEFTVDICYTNFVFFLMSNAIPLAIAGRFLLSLTNANELLKHDHLLSSPLTSYPRCAPYIRQF